MLKSSRHSGSNKSPRAKATAALAVTRLQNQASSASHRAVPGVVGESLTVLYPLNDDESSFFLMYSYIIYIYIIIHNTYIYIYILYIYTYIPHLIS